MHAIYELKEKLCDELEEYGEKKLDAGSLDVIDKLAHTIKNLDKIIENYEEGNYSGYDGDYDDGIMMDGPYNRSGSFERDGRGSSYARGRGRNAKRDSMGRYASRGYAMDNASMVKELRELMKEAPDERTRQEFRTFISKMEQN